ncbi:MAG: choice-of-anchor D domain-containing protein [Verrucomicrobia bacterium]|nr:choice-of-anchor D domain-containing protein [Verrucomicrobiota bacterium]
MNTLAVPLLAAPAHRPRAARLMRYSLLSLRRHAALLGWAFLFSATLSPRAQGQANNADLASLTFSAGISVPAFDAATASYTQFVQNSTSTVTLTPTAAAGGATILVNGQPVSSGAASGNLTLAVGPNAVSIVVTAPDTVTTRTYNVTVQRAVRTATAGGLSSYTVPGGPVQNVALLARGADGGFGQLAAGSPPGGAGATMVASYALAGGDVLTLINGSAGLDGITDARSAGSGGGGSGVVRNASQVLIAAGGGGGHARGASGGGGQANANSTPAGGASVGATAGGGGGGFGVAGATASNGAGGGGAGALNALSAGGAGVDDGLIPGRTGGGGFGGGGGSFGQAAGGGGGYAGGAGSVNGLGPSLGGDSFVNTSVASGSVLRAIAGLDDGASRRAGELNVFLLPSPARAVTLASTGRGASRQIFGQVTSDAVPTNVSVVFEIGPDTNYGTTVAATPANVASLTPVSVSAALSNLPLGTYHYRVVATGPGGTTYGADAVFEVAPPLPSGTLTIGPSGDYASLTAFLARLAYCEMSGPIVLELQANYSSASETFPLVFSNLGTTSTNTLTIRPAADATGLSIVGAAAVTVDLDGAKFVTFDGRPGGVGSHSGSGVGTVSQLSLGNTSTSGVTVRLLNDATDNALRYLTVAGVNSTAASGTIVFGTTTGTTGNDNNTIDHCDIRDGASTPLTAIYSLGSSATTAQANSGNTVSNCNIFNFYGNADATGVRLDSFNSDWTITGNSFYQTATRAAVLNVSSRCVSIVASTGGNFLVSGNVIGGTQPNAGGTPWTTTGTLVNHGFVGIRLNVAASPVSSVQGNVIRNLAWTTGSSSANGAWGGIQVTSGSVDIGTVTPNVVGSVTGTGSVTLLSSNTTSGLFGLVGIYANSAGTVNIANNHVGGLTTTAVSVSNSTSIAGIIAGGTGGFTISGNTIGSTTTANSLHAQTATTDAGGQQVFGISTNGASTVVAGNTVANLRNGYAGTSATALTRGIVATAGTNSITGNLVRDLASASQATGELNSTSVCGIAQTSNTSPQLVAQNTIHSLSNSAATSASTVTGIYFSSGTVGTFTISQNLVHSLSVASSSASSAVNGLAFGAGAISVANNFVRVGLDAAGNSSAAASIVRGIFDSGTTPNRRFQHNSIYVGGVATSGAANSFGLTSIGLSNVRFFRNNLLVNARGNSGATGKHYAVQIGGAAANPTGLTSAGNLFLASSPNGGVLGLFASTDRLTLADWRAATGQDATSVSDDPRLLSATGPAASLDLHVAPNSPVLFAGVPTEITTDFDGDPRSATAPFIGADEFVAAFLTVQSPVGTALVDGGSRSFGAVLQGSTTDVVFQLTNPGNATVTGLAASLDGANADEFSVLTQPPTSLAPGASASFTVRHVSATPGSKTAALHLANSLPAPLHPFDVALTASSPADIVLEQPAGTALADGGTRDFGNVATGAAADLVFSITNPGLGDLTGLAVTFDGADAAEFTVLVAPPALLAPGASATFTVRHRPVALGFKSAALHVVSNVVGAKNPYDVALTARSLPDLVVERPAGTVIADGGTSALGTVVYGAPNDFVFTVRNVGLVDLTDLAVTFDGADGARFSVLTPPASPVPPGGSTTFTVRFQPNRPGANSAALHLASNAFGALNPYDLSLTANAVSAPLSGTRTVGPTGYYASLTHALQDLPVATLAGPLVLELQPTYSSAVETFPLVFGNLATAANPLTIRPASGAPALSITSADAITIDLNGAQYVTFDGRPGGVGTHNGSGVGAVSRLSVANTNSSGVAVRFINEGRNNTLRYVTFASVNATPISGTIVFSGTTGPDGNDGNTLDHCDLRDGSSPPANALYGFGSGASLGQFNSGNTVSNCNIYNFYSTSDSAGVRLDGGNTGWTISGNSFFQTASRAAVAGTARAIMINSSQGGSFLISGNFIGGSEPNAGGTPWTTTGTSAVYSFQGIRLSMSTVPASSIQDNTIRNFAWSSGGNISAPGNWAGIYLAGGAGTVSGNTIGSATGNDAITLLASTNTGGTTIGLCGIYSSGGGTTTISNNAVGSLTATATLTSNVSSIVGIAAVSGQVTITGNTIGSATTANSLNAASASTNGGGQQVTGILLNGTTSASVTNNLIANLNNNYAGTSTAGQVRGIFTNTGVNTVTGNTVRHLSTSSQNGNLNNSQSVFGISANSSTSGQTIAQNVVHSLSNTTTSAAVCVTGICFVAGSTGSHTIERNLVHSLVSTSSSASGGIHGLHVLTGPVSVQNNLVRLGLDADGNGLTGGAILRGIYDNGTTAGRSFLHNSVYVGGVKTSGAAGSRAFDGSSGTTNTRTYRNNLFVNARSNSGSATGLHYAVAYGGTTANPTGLTASHNLLWASGVGGVLGLYNSGDRPDLASWQAATGQDAASLSVDPLFLNPTGDAASFDLHLAVASPARLAGAAGTGVTLDFDGQARDANFPTIGADEIVGAPDIAVAQGAALTDGVSSVDFGSVPQNVSGTPLTFTITNPGLVNLTGLAVTVDGPDAADFLIGPLSDTTVPPGSGSVTFTVTFRPGANGARQAALHIASNVTGAKNPFDIALTGTGAGTPPAILSAAGTIFTVGSSGSFTVQTSGVPTPTLSVSGALPSGVTFTPATGVLAGLPAVGTGGSYPLVFTADNGVPPAVTQNFTLVINRPPLGGALTLGTTRDTPVSGPASRLVLASSDPDGDPVTLVAVSAASAQGGAVVFTAGNVTYTPPTGFTGTDSYTFTVADGRGGFGAGTVTVTVSAPAIGNGAGITVTMTAAGPQIRATGIPARFYTLEVSDNLSGVWTTLASVQAGRTGTIQYTDTTQPLPSSRFYRLR